MGATTYTEITTGTDVREAFRDLVDEAISYNGSDPYNGTISTTQLGREVQVSKSAMKATNQDSYKYFDEMDDNLFPSKWETQYAELGVDHYKAYTIKWFDDKQTTKRKKGVTMVKGYTVKQINGRYRHTEFQTLTEAKKYAKEMTYDREKPYEIRKHRSDGSKFRIGYMDLTTDGKEYKSARKAKTKIYKPVKKFAFFVYAAC